MDRDAEKASPVALVLQVAGALGSLGALVYLIGSSVLWLRARLVGLPADVAIEHLPRASIIALGMYGVTLVLAWYAFLASLAATLIGAGVAAHNLACHREWFSTPREPVRFQPLVCRWATALTPHPVAIASVDAVLIVLASLLSWQALALAVGAVSAFGGAVRWLDETSRFKLVGTLGLAFAAVVAGLGWQITSRVPEPAVFLRSASHGLSGPVPYFGETSDFIYVGVEAPHHVHRIEELRRGDYLLTFAPRPFTYCRVNDRPIEAATGFLHLESSPAQKAVRC